MFSPKTILAVYKKMKNLSNYANKQKNKSQKPKKQTSKKPKKSIKDVVYGAFHSNKIVETIVKQHEKMTTGPKKSIVSLPKAPQKTPSARSPTKISHGGHRRHHRSSSRRVIVKPTQPQPKTLAGQITEQTKKVTEVTREVKKLKPISISSASTGVSISLTKSDVEMHIKRVEEAKKRLFAKAIEIKKLERKIRRAKKPNPQLISALNKKIEEYNREAKRFEDVVNPALHLKAQVEGIKTAEARFRVNQLFFPETKPKRKTDYELTTKAVKTTQKVFGKLLGPETHDKDIGSLLVTGGKRFVRSAATTAVGVATFTGESLIKVGKSIGKSVATKSPAPVIKTGTKVAGSTLVGTATFLGSIGSYFERNVPYEDFPIFAAPLFPAATASYYIATKRKPFVATRRKIERLKKKGTEEYLTGMGLAGSILGAELGMKPFEHAYRISKNVYYLGASKLSKSYIKPEQFKFVESVTIPKTKRQLLAMQEKEVPAIHMTFHKEIPKAVKKAEMILEAKPEFAKGWRKKLDALHFYVSAPHKGKPTAYLGYVGIGAQESLSTKPQFFLFSPKKYMLVFKEKVAKVPKSILKSKNVSKIARWVGEPGGKLKIPTENLLGKSTEGQFVIPAKFKGKFAEYPGSKILLRKEGWTLYKQVPKFVRGNVLGEILFGKFHKLHIVKAKIKNLKGKMLPIKTKAIKISYKKYVSSAYGKPVVLSSYGAKAVGLGLFSLGKKSRTVSNISLLKSVSYKYSPIKLKPLSSIKFKRSSEKSIISFPKSLATSLKSSFARMIGLKSSVKSQRSSKASVLSSVSSTIASSEKSYMLSSRAFSMQYLSPLMKKRQKPFLLGFTFTKKKKRKKKSKEYYKEFLHPIPSFRKFVGRGL